MACRAAGKRARKTGGRGGWVERTGNVPALAGADRLLPIVYLLGIDFIGLSPLLTCLANALPVSSNGLMRFRIASTL